MLELIERLKELHDEVEYQLMSVPPFPTPERLREEMKRAEECLLGIGIVF